MVIKLPNIEFNMSIYNLQIYLNTINEMRCRIYNSYFFDRKTNDHFKEDRKLVEAIKSQIDNIIATYKDDNYHNDDLFEFMYDVEEIERYYCDEKYPDIEDYEFDENDQIKFIINNKAYVKITRHLKWNSFRTYDPKTDDLVNMYTYDLEVRDDNDFPFLCPQISERGIRSDEDDMRKLSPRRLDNYIFRLHIITKYECIGQLLNP